MRGVKGVMVLAMACIALASSTLLIEQNATPAQRDETNARAEAITLLGESQNQADESSLVNEVHIASHLDKVLSTHLAVEGQD